eukprot:gb/GFBE01039628.1/.p1 GENE.gb/GFBE01039628.1/~~gb/GFBE01039628.1/.p1  ORF type:complete len:160 (+),score=8.96 gb/GFBE01039628.1/:1-480(+)
MVPEGMASPPCGDGPPAQDQKAQTASNKPNRTQQRTVQCAEPFRKIYTNKPAHASRGSPRQAAHSLMLLLWSLSKSACSIPNSPSHRYPRFSSMPRVSATELHSRLHSSMMSACMPKSVQCSHAQVAAEYPKADELVQVASDMDEDRQDASFTRVAEPR